MRSRTSLAATLTLLVALAWSGRALALPIAPWDLSGSNAIISEYDRMTARYEGTGAYYSNDLYLMLDSYGNVADDGDLMNDLLIFNNHSSVVGSTFDIDNVTVGEEVLFRLFVHDTGYNYYSGQSIRNPDGKPHAMFQREWQPGLSLVSFEDLFGTPEYRRGYNDLSFSFRNTRTSEVPEPHTTGLLLVGVAGLMTFRKRKAQQS